MFFIALFCSITFCNHYAQSTEVTVASSMIDNSLGMEIELPVLMCHAKHTEYKEVTWYKDYMSVKKGSADLASHMLSLSSLLNSTISSVVFDNPLKLQGYYWCETELTLTSTIHDYLFRIKEIHTFVGRLVATKDSLGDRETLSEEEKLTWKMQIYEEEMQTQLFGFLPPPSIHVTSMKVYKNGLGVRFFVYSRQVFSGRKPIKNELVRDEHELASIKEYLRNETTAVHSELYDTALRWTDLLGIDIENIGLRSTLGCYEETYLMSSNKSEELVWPYARIGEVVIPENACSTREGLAVTRMCTGSFFTGAVWGSPSGKCEKSAGGITLQLKNLYDEFGNEKRPYYIQMFSNLMKQSIDLGVTDLHIAIEILEELSRLSNLGQQEVSGILSVIDRIAETNKTELIAAKNIIRLTSRILRIFDNLLESADKEGKEIQISKKNLMIDIKSTKAANEGDHVLGLAVIAPDMQNTLSKGSIELVTINNSLLKRNNAVAYFVLPLELILHRESKLDFPCQVNMVFFKDWYLFQNPKGALVKRNYKVLPSPVMYVSISGGPAWNLTDPVHLYFKDMLNVDVENMECVYYDPRLEDGAGAWSSEGCEYKGFINGYYRCQCHHLSIFAVIPSQSPQSGQKLERLRLGTSVYVGCGVSMLALSVAVLLYILSKHWRQTVDHSLLFCLSLSFLICIIIIFISEMYFARKNGCIALALILHYFILSIFGWLSVQAVVYRLRFAKKTDVGEIPHFMIKSALAVWGVPVVIVVVMWLSREYPCAEDNCWLTVGEVSKEALIPIVLLILVTLCINVCATYSLTCRYRKDFLIGDSSYNDVALKFRVAFTIFFFFAITWLFGFLALHQRSQTLRILFSICITLSAYYVSLFFIFQEISFWDLCSRCKRNEEPEDPPAVQYKANTYNAVDEGDCSGK